MSFKGMIRYYMEYLEYMAGTCPGTDEVCLLNWSSAVYPTQLHVLIGILNKSIRLQTGWFLRRINLDVEYL